jgi:uncharacterized protein YndB with AHSA1/START domain
MTVTNVQKDPQALTMSITADLAAPIKRVWQLWEDPRELERWWGPPTYPATFVDYDLAPGAMVTYFMTGPEGDKKHGWLRVTGVDAPYRLEFEDGLADDTGEPFPDLPVMNMTVNLKARPEGGTSMEILTRFPSLEAMAQILEMGMEEGMSAAMSQIDALL